MAGARQPTDLVVMNGRKHLTRAEEDARRDREVVVPAPQRAKPPKWLPKELHREFRAIGKQLIDVGLYTDLDADNLGRYLVAHHEYISATAEVQRALTQAPGHARDLEAADGWGRVQVDSLSNVIITSLPAETGTMPDVRGMGLKDALFVLESRGLKVRFSGRGAVVRQSVAPGARITPGATVAITLN